MSISRFNEDDSRQSASAERLKTDKKMREILKKLGPGLLFAGAAIGVSHLVQSTRAGAMYGFDLWWAIVAIHLVKYPFFQFGPRYVAATGRNLLHGYKELGTWAIVTFIVVTLGTVLTIQAAVTVVTAAITAYLFHIDWPLWELSALILFLCGALLYAEKFYLLDRSIKFIILILTVCTMLAVAAAFSKGYHPPRPVHFEWNKAGIAFLIALMGWMPSPLDLSVWVSFWNEEKNRQLGSRMKLRDTLRDFNIGYWGTMVVALIFMALGALIMHGRGVEFSPKGAVFARQLIEMYTGTLGDWAYWIIGGAALTTMLSTTLTVFDGIPRTLEKTSVLIRPQWAGMEKSLYRGYMLLIGSGAIILLALFIENMQGMVDVATILSFCTAPFFAFANYRVIRRSTIAPMFRPSRGLIVLSRFGILFLTAFAAYYLILLIKL